MGRHKKFNNIDDLKQRIQDYFNDCDVKNTQATKANQGREKIAKPYLLTGLCRCLGITTDTFMGYARDERYKPLIFSTLNILDDFITEYTIKGLIPYAYTQFLQRVQFNYKDNAGADNSNAQLKINVVRRRETAPDRADIKII
jgi:hypothetical protein